jgi:hypothetical protein
MPAQHAVDGALLALGALSDAPAEQVRTGSRSDSMAEHLAIEGVTVRAIGLLDYSRILCAYLMVLVFLGTVVAIDGLKGDALLPFRSWIAVFTATTLLFSRGFVVYFPRAVALAGGRRPIIRRSATILDRRFYRLEYRGGDRTRRSWVVEPRAG